VRHVPQVAYAFHSLCFLIKEKIEANRPEALLIPNHFRFDRLYTLKVHFALQKQLPLAQAAFHYYRTFRPPGQPVQVSQANKHASAAARMLSLDGWNRMFEDAQVCASRFVPVSPGPALT
jgi:hypothetical protein